MSRPLHFPFLSAPCLAEGVLLGYVLIFSVVFLFIRPESILISVMVDTAIIGFLFVLTLGTPELIISTETRRFDTDGQVPSLR